MGTADLLADSSDGYTLWASASSDGKLLVVTKSRTWMNVSALALPSGKPSTLTTTRSIDQCTGWGSNGSSVLFQSDRTGRNQIFRQKLETDENPERLIQGSDDQREAQTSPDGKWILYWSTPHGNGGVSATKELMRFPIDGGSPEKTLETTNDDQILFQCSPVRQASCALSKPDAGKLAFYGLDPVHGVTEQIATLDLMPAYWALSRDGSYLAITTATIPPQLLLVSLANPTQRNVTVLAEWAIRDLAWASDGKSLYAVGVHDRSNSILKIELDGKTHVVLDRGKNHAAHFLQLSPDGEHIAFSEFTWEGNTWLIENF